MVGKLLATRAKKQTTRARNTQKAAPPAWALLIARGFREGTLIFLLFMSLFLLVALSSFDPGDPGWSSVSNATNIHNMGGRIGAWCADVLMSLFGYFAFLFPILIGYRAWLIFKDFNGPWSWLLTGLRTLGFIMCMLAATGLAYLHFEVVPGTLPAIDSADRNGAGGILGIEFGQVVGDELGELGGTLLLLALFLLGLTMFADISWIRVMDTLGRVTLVGLEWLLQLPGKLQAYQQHRAEAKVQMLAERQAARAEKERQKALQRDQKKAKADAAKAQAAKQAVEKAKAKEAARAAKAAKAAAAENKGVANIDQPPVAMDGPSIQQLPLKITEASKPKIGKKQKRRPVRTGDPILSGDIPSFDLLDPADDDAKTGFSAEALADMSRLLELKLADFNVEATVENVLPGPVITRFEIQPAAGIKVSRITNLAKDLARSLAVISVRVVEVIPGKTVVGIEIPNENREIIRLGEVIASDEFDKVKSPLSLALGKDISGLPIIADLQKMPHLLVAGTTGSGKSVGLNAMLLSMLFKATPDELRLIMIDPKMLELSVYDNIPHLLTPVVTDMKEASNALRWCVAEMERRYRLMAAMGVRNLAGFNKKIRDAIAAGEPIKDPLFKPELDSQEPEELEPLPFIVVVVDEFADMMMIVGKKVEEQIARIAQKARAAGIHLILATQRPSVDVITGLIKANVPTRIGFQVSSKVDSRTILDQGGAEQLLGHGDMLYLPPGTGLPVRVHGAFVDDDEVHRVCDDWRARGEPDYLDEILEGTHEAGPAPGDEAAGDGDSESDPLYDQAVQFVTETRRASISSVQRKLKIGYNRAARMIETMEAAGVISTMGTNGQREVLAPPPR